MIRVTVAYPNEQGKNFDWDYYTDHHLNLVHEQLDSRGLVRMEIDKGISAPDPNDPPPFVAIAHLFFNTVDEVHEGFKATGRAIMGDIKNYTDIAPTIQISEILS
jgi:uncharacterized protein (TIGR02118 family)